MPKKIKTPTEPRSSIPMPARVQEDEEFRPVAMGQIAVVSIDDRVEEDSEWWGNEPVYKMHYRVTLEDGRELEIFRNYKTGSWYRAVGD